MENCNNITKTTTTTIIIMIIIIIIIILECIYMKSSQCIIHLFVGYTLFICILYFRPIKL